MKNFISRRKKEEIKERLARESAVMIVGPYQAGKTILAQEIGAELGACYMNLLDPETARKIRKSSLRECVEEHGKHLTIIDGVQADSSLFPSLLPLIDGRRREGKDKGSFLLLGSASPALANRSDETLKGRIRYVRIDPLDVTEMDAPAEMDKLWLRGGLPRSFMADDDQESFDWLDSFINNLNRWSLRKYGLRMDPYHSDGLLINLAQQHGSRINKSKMEQELDIYDLRKVERVIDLLHGLMLVRILPAYSKARVKNFNKKPKIYVTDSGLLHQWLNINSWEQLQKSPMAGPSWEGFMIENILRHADARVRASYFRTNSGCGEAALVMEYPGGAVWALDILGKKKIGYRKSFAAARRSIGPDRSFIVHGRLDLPRHPYSPDVEIISLSDMCRAVAAKAKEAQVANAGSAPPGSKPE